MSSSSNRYSDQVPSAGIRFKRTTRVPFFQEQEPGQSSSSHQKQNGLRVVTLTWNVAGYSPSEPGEARQLRKELARELFCEDHADDDGKEQSYPDLIFLGFQEVVELKVKEVMSFFWQSTGKQVSNVEVWEQMVVLPLLGSQIAGAGVEAQQLASDDVAVDPFTGIATDPGSRSHYMPETTTRRKSPRVGYKIVAREQLVGLVLWVVARCNPASRREEDDERQSGGLLPQLPPLLVTQCQVDAIRTAALGLLGTKGALVASIEIVLGAHNKTFTVCAVNVHLPSGEKVENVEERKAAVSQVFAHLGAATEEYDFFLFFGDLNARVNVNYGGGGGNVYGGNNYPGGNFYGNGNGNAYAYGASATSGGRSAGVPPQQQLRPDRDDLACVLRKTTPLGVFEEGAVTFPPTFKYFRGGNDGGGLVGVPGRGCRLELNMQKSAPAWTDRVLFYSAKDRSPPPESCASLGARTGRTADLVVCSPPSSSKVLRYETSERLWHAIRGGSDHLPVVSSLALEFNENNGTAAGADPFASSATSRTSTSSQPPRRPADSVGVGQRFPTHQPLSQEPKTQQAEIVVNRGQTQSSRGPGTAPPPVRAYELVVHPAGVFLPPDWDEFELMLQCTPGDSLLGIWSTTAQNGRGKGQNFKVSSYSLPVADYATSSGAEAAELPLWVGYGSQEVRFRRVGNGVSAGGPWEDILLVRVIENKGSLEGAAGGVVYVAVEFDGG
eukprot:g8269.t1